MTLTAEHAATRRRFLTASDVAAVLGLNPWTRPADVWLAKRHDLAPDESSEAAEFGNDMEPVLVQREARRLGITDYQTQVWCEAPNGFMGATLDALATAKDRGIEAKTSGIFNPYALDESWGDAETDQIPKQYLVQVASQLVCCPSMLVVHIPALLGGRGPCSFIVERSGPGVSDLCAAIEEKAGDLWQRYMVRGDDPPADDLPPSLDVLKRMRRTPKSCVPVDADLVTAWESAKGAAKEATARAQEAQERLLAALGDAESGECDLGTLTYLEQSRKGYTVDPATFRVLRFKAAK